MGARVKGHRREDKGCTLHGAWELWTQGGAVRERDGWQAKPITRSAALRLVLRELIYDTSPVLLSLARAVIYQVCWAPEILGQVNHKRVRGGLAPGRRLTPSTLSC